MANTPPQPHHFNTDDADPGYREGDGNTKTKIERTQIKACVTACDMRTRELSPARSNPTPPIFCLPIPGSTTTLYPPPHLLQDLQHSWCMMPDRFPGITCHCLASFPATPWHPDSPPSDSSPTANRVEREKWVFLIWIDIPDLAQYICTRFDVPDTVGDMAAETEMPIEVEAHGECVFEEDCLIVGLGVPGLCPLPMISICFQSLKDGASSLTYPIQPASLVRSL